MLFLVIVPTRRNDGTPVGSDEMQEIIDDLWMRFGGVAIEGRTQGHWIDQTDGSHYQDEGQKMMVETSRDRLPEAIETAKEIGRRLGQKAIFLEIRYYDGIQILRTDD